MSGTRSAGGADDVRLVLGGRNSPQGGLDGAWWPYTRTLFWELPGLVRAVSAGTGRRVVRIALHPEEWDRSVRRTHVDGQLVHHGWFRSLDRHLVRLTLADGSGLDVLVVPPEEPADVARQAMRSATRRGNTRCATDCLVGARRDVLATLTGQQVVESRT